MKIEKFKAYDEKVIETWGQPKDINYSDIVDKLIRLAAKYTDSYASDVIIDVNIVAKDIDNAGNGIIKGSYLFGFREHGVDHAEYVLNNEERELSSRYRCIWRLDVNRREKYRNDIVMRFYRVEYTNY